MKEDKSKKEKVIREKHISFKIERTERGYDAVLDEEHMKIVKEIAKDNSYGLKTPQEVMLHAVIQLNENLKPRKNETNTISIFTDKEDNISIISKCPHCNNDNKKYFIDLLGDTSCILHHTQECTNCKQQYIVWYQKGIIPIEVNTINPVEEGEEE